MLFVVSWSMTVCKHGLDDVDEGNVPQVSVGDT